MTFTVVKILQKGGHIIDHHLPQRRLRVKVKGKDNKSI